MDADTYDTLEDLAAVLTLPLGIFAAVSVGGGAAIAVFVVGWLLLVPAFDTLGDAADTGADAAAETEPAAGTVAEADAPETPLDTLRERYAAGEIDEIEFERRLENLIATEDADEGETESALDADLNVDRES